jgi:hypothetical protein
MQRELGFVREPDETIVRGLGNEASQRVMGKVTLILQAKNGHAAIAVEALILHQITGLIPEKEINIDAFVHTQGVDFADNSFHIPQQVDLLLGADVYTQIFLPIKSRRVDGFPLHKTIFGEVVFGQLNCPKELRPSIEPKLDLDASAGARVGLSCNSNGKIVAPPSLKRGSSHDTPQSADVRLAVTNTCAPTHQVAYSSIIQKLSLKPNAPTVGYSFVEARHALDKLWRKFNEYPELKQPHEVAFCQLIKAGFLEEVPQSQQKLRTSRTNYIPHDFVEDFLSNGTGSLRKPPDCFRWLDEGSRRTHTTIPPQSRSIRQR